MSDDITRAINWVGCTTNSPAHAHEIRLDALKALADLRADLAAANARAYVAEGRLGLQIQKADSLNASLVETERSRDAARADLAAAREALKPFAKAADNFDSFKINNTEEWFCYSGEQSHNETRGAITVGDLRRARAALKGAASE